MFYDKLHELVRELKNSEEYKKFLDLKNELNKDKEAYELLKDFKKKQEEHQLNYINGKDMAKEDLDQMQNLYSLIIQNETSRKLLEAEMRINVMLADMNKIIGEALKEIIDF